VSANPAWFEMALDNSGEGATNLSGKRRDGYPSQRRDAVWENLSGYAAFLQRNNHGKLRAPAVFNAGVFFLFADTLLRQHS